MRPTNGGTTLARYSSYSSLADNDDQDQDLLNCFDEDEDQEAISRTTSSIHQDHRTPGRTPQKAIFQPIRSLSMRQPKPATPSTNHQSNTTSSPLHSPSLIPNTFPTSILPVSNPTPHKPPLKRHNHDDDEMRDARDIFNNEIKAESISGNTDDESDEFELEFSDDDSAYNNNQSLDSRPINNNLDRRKNIKNSSDDYLIEEERAAATIRNTNLILDKQNVDTHLQPKLQQQNITSISSRTLLQVAQGNSRSIKQQGRGVLKFKGFGDDDDHNGEVDGNGDLQNQEQASAPITSLQTLQPTSNQLPPETSLELIKSLIQQARAQQKSQNLSKKTNGIDSQFKSLLNPSTSATSPVPKVSSQQRRLDERLSGLIHLRMVVNHIRTEYKLIEDLVVKHHINPHVLNRADLDYKIPLYGPDSKTKAGRSRNDDDDDDVQVVAPPPKSSTTTVVNSNGKRPRQKSIILDDSEDETASTSKTTPTKTVVKQQHKQQQPPPPQQAVQDPTDELENMIDHVFPKQDEGEEELQPALKPPLTLSRQRNRQQKTKYQRTNTNNVFGDDYDDVLL